MSFKDLTKRAAAAEYSKPEQAQKPADKKPVDVAPTETAAAPKKL